MLVTLFSVLLILSSSTSLVIAATWAFTHIRFAFQNLPCRKFRGLEPPALPYCAPWLGNALYLLWNPHRFLRYVKQTASNGQPVKVRLANEKAAYIISNPNHVQLLFRASKDLGFEDFSVRVLEKVKKFPHSDGLIMLTDKSGPSQASLLPGVPEESRIWRAIHRNYQNNLTGIESVQSLTKRFSSLLSQELDTVAGSDTWSFASINSLMEDKMFKASTISLAGPRIFELRSDFSKDFWEYDRYFMKFLYGLPKFIYPSGWAARDRVFDAVRVWITSAWENIDWDQTDSNCAWEENFGSKLVRTREQMYNSFGYTLEGRVASEMGLIWSINSNAIPMVSWILIEIISDPKLLQRVQNEVLAATSMSDSGPSLDLGQLGKLPILNSSYSECLRLRASIQVVRELRNDMELDGYTLKAGNIVMAPSWLSHYGESWATADHPVDTFFAERFVTNRELAKSGMFFPYGGGDAICPGRYYAKAEILAAVALFIFTFEIESLGFVDHNGSPSRRPGMGNETRGTMKLDRDLRVRLRKR